MSVQFGFWNFNHAVVELKDIAQVKTALAPYAPEGMEEFSGGEIHLLHLPFRVTCEAEQEIQPFQMPSGRILLWDGRLDNRQDLIRLLGAEVRRSCSDAEIASMALERWETDALSKLIGDWALSIWNPHEQTVLLAKDFLGTRALYYAITNHFFAWSTLLDPLLLAKKQAFHLQEEYLAGSLAHFPGTHVTPFAGIQSVPPGSSVLFRAKSATVRKYWDFDSGKKIHYREDREYEEHFREVFGEAVRRRLRSKTPVLSELSGGMDSSSIVCMADALAARGLAETPRLDTISYFDDSEPNWNESPFFQRVEQQRGRTGFHMALNSRDHWNPAFDRNVFAGSPGCGINTSENADYIAHLHSGPYRVLLKGIGGDEVLGGVPTPVPELADLLLSGHFRKFLRQMIAWAVTTRTPVLHLLRDTLRPFLPSFISHEPLSSPAWLCRDFVKRNRYALSSYSRRFRFLGPSPSFQANSAAFDTLRRQIAATGLSPLLPVERRYPFLDRDLLEFLYAIPREQLVRPNRRRSLMRRALVGIVPNEILNRRRKAFITRSPLISLQADLERLLRHTDHMIVSRAGIVDAAVFQDCLKQAALGKELPIVHILRTLQIEAWLAHLSQCAGTSMRFELPGDRPLVFSGDAPVTPKPSFS